MPIKSKKDKKIENLKDRAKKIDCTIEYLEGLESGRIKPLISDPEDLVSVILGSGFLSAPFYSFAAAPLTGVTERAEDIADVWKKGSKVGAIALGAICSPIMLVYGALGVALAAPGVALHLPLGAVAGTVGGITYAISNKRIKNAPKRIESLQKEKETLLKEINELEQQKSTNDRTC